ncbi:MULTISPECIES: aspartyl-phosphate phosphatase Spo0E family protein [Desulfitobacterium]|uniref:Spo0E like sporulation regulatory protein n=1 Tax=Desulfitobacterium dehalogenans (strain ATCC 51507 / DSM 9161 / JW/IU-DC1) TaxID=756499 RepID=I4A9X0_DESDJ|nr:MULTISPECIES: aspartyl-phosphate phosphatase Spo0E family protein [Desulfitobacterium]AFM00755.1 Spo0E like sporulation regulatory protein [Desulfitobacterium dehalogenans ATCC 51507]
MTNFDEILKQIERLREDMHRLAEEKELTDPSVVAASQMLDAALNAYYKFIKDKVKNE